jgi:hypothetical protein
MLLFGGQVLRSFSWALFIGILIGTYSTMYIASPFMLWWESWRGRSRAAVVGGAGASVNTGNTGNTGNKGASAPGESSKVESSGVTPQMLAAAGVSTAPRKPRKKGK